MSKNILVYRCSSLQHFNNSKDTIVHDRLTGIGLSHSNFPKYSRKEEREDDMLELANKQTNKQANKQHKFPQLMH